MIKSSSPMPLSSESGTPRHSSSTPLSSSISFSRVAISFEMMTKSA